MAKSTQHEIPEGFRRRWRVGGASWETPYAGRIGTMLGYERAEDGGDLVRLRFDSGSADAAPIDALFTPWQLFAVDVAGGMRPGKATLDARNRQMQERRRRKRCHASLGQGVS